MGMKPKFDPKSEDNFGRTREEIHDRNDRAYLKRQSNKIFIKCECGEGKCKDQGRLILSDSIRKTRRLNNGIYLCSSCQRRRVLERGGMTEEIKAKISKSVSKRIEEGSFQPSHNSIDGWLPCSKAVNSNVLHIRSSYEAVFVQRVIDDPEAVTIQSEPLTIQYLFENAERTYIPDFLVSYRDNTRVLYEIKPAIQVSYDKNRAKFSAAESYCREKGMVFKIITEKDLGIPSRGDDTVQVSTLEAFYPVFWKALEAGDGLNGETVCELIQRSKSVGTKYWRLFLKKYGSRLEKRGSRYYLLASSTHSEPPPEPLPGQGSPATDK